LVKRKIPSEALSLGKMRLYHGAVCLLICIVSRSGKRIDAFSVPRKTIKPSNLISVGASLISLKSTVSPNGNNEEGDGMGPTPSISNARRSLAQMEDVEEERLQRIDSHRKKLNKSASNSIKSSASSSGTDALNNGMFEEEDAENARRQQTIQQILEEDDAVWKEERRMKMLGKFANVTNEEEWKQLEDEERSIVQKENERKAEIAKASGVTLTILEAADDLSSSQQSDTSSIDARVAGRKPDSWFQDIDKQLSSEIPQLGSSDSTSRIVNGKLVTNVQQSGIQVGSAGGWNLEVFPGDFVVHRKYGIGRYEGTLLKPKKKIVG